MTWYYLTRVDLSGIYELQALPFWHKLWLLKTSCGFRETPAIRVRRSCTTFQNDLQKLLLWIREQQAFKLPLKTPAGGPAVFHCCVEQSYLFISQFLFRLERKNFSFWRSVTKHWGERKFLYILYIYIHTHTLSLSLSLSHSPSFPPQSRKWNGKGSRH